MKLEKYTDYRSLHNVLTQPMSEDDLNENVRKDGTIQAKVVVPFESILDNNLDWLKDEVSDLITGSESALSDITFVIVGTVTKENKLIIKVTGTVDFAYL